jgi:hypothetical protein
MLKHRVLFASLIAVLSLLAAAVSISAHEEGEIPTFPIESTEDGISLPPELPAGLVTLSFENGNEAPFTPILARLNEDVTFEQFAEALNQGPETAIPLVSLLGAPQIAPEASFDVTYNFEPGTHVLMDFESEVPVIETFTVVEGEVEQVVESEADVTVVLVDYLFGMPVEIEAGVKHWSIENAGEEWHEMGIFHVEEGTTVEEAVEVITAAMEQETEPEMEQVFFWTPLSPGEQAQFELELEAGTYLVICFLPSFADGSPHFAHGMAQIITVSE